MRPTLNGAALLRPATAQATCMRCMLDVEYLPTCTLTSVLGMGMQKNSQHTRAKLMRREQRACRRSRQSAACHGCARCAGFDQCFVICREGSVQHFVNACLHAPAGVSAAVWSWV
jgi:hypothetical protein